jgi:hypothetical protein
MNKYILVTGDRNYNDFKNESETRREPGGFFKNIENVLLSMIIEKYPPTEYIFVNGYCKGADKISKYIF